MITVYFVNGRKAVLDPKHVIFATDPAAEGSVALPMANPDRRTVLVNWNHVCYVQAVQEKEDEHDAE